MFSILKGVFGIVKGGVKLVGGIIKRRAAGRYARGKGKRYAKDHAKGLTPQQIEQQEKNQQTKQDLKDAANAKILDLLQNKAGALDFKSMVTTPELTVDASPATKAAGSKMALIVGGIVAAVIAIILIVKPKKK